MKSSALERSPKLGGDKDTSFLSGSNAVNKTLLNAQAQEQREAHKKVIQMQKEMSSQEKLALVDIKPIEKNALDKVFHRLCKATPKFFDGDKEYFVAEDIAKVLIDLKFKMTKHEIDLMVWVYFFFFIIQREYQEVDENLDKKVDRDEFDTMFRRCITNETELDPKSLFNLVRFLMYAKEDAFEITEEDALELIYVRKNSIEGLEEALKIIFG